MAPPVRHSPFELSFSAATRAEHWAALGSRRFDLLVIGGGITGTAVAYEAAGRGLDVALVEAGDFAEGTSSRSSRLIHGGLRYLETFDFRLVFEALGERRHLLRLAPHLVHPLPFLFPVYRGAEVGPLKLRAGMWLYDALSLFHTIHRHRMLGRRAALGREPALAAEGLRGAALYYDAQVDDARLTLAVARAAHLGGAVTTPRAEVVELLREDGALAGARVRDARSGAESEVRARLVVNATGPWSDALRRLADPAAPPRLRPSKGVHVQIARERLGNHGAIIFRSALDDRVMFILPWGDFTYVGTTDTDFDRSPGEASADAEDVDYLLRSANALFPEARLAAADVLSTWAGVRPLLAPPDSGEGVGQTSREHEVWRDPSGLLCIAGGKLTTFRVMAEDTVDEAARILAEEHQVEAGRFFSDELPLPGAPAGPWPDFRTRFLAAAAAQGLPDAAAEHLLASHGADAEGLLRTLAEEPRLAEPILPPLPYLWVEVHHAVRGEMALTLEDVLRRRLHLFNDAPDGGAGVAEAVAREMAPLPGLEWTAEQVDAEVQAYRAAVARTRRLD